ncbi:integrase arm-type DNA-binding domain-containing protein [Variovorax paradoxus]|jgi:integrase|uniref:tyrosine-type recombinase/integrase n=1 Tax=Variovorax paradoxus TaxID=34073 RepID=UPI0004238CC2
MLTDTFVRQVKHKGSEIGERYADGGGMYLRVKAAGKYWRMDYRFNGKAKTLALGVYPAVSLAKARQRRDKARELLADNVDPGLAKRAEKLSRAVEAANTFEALAREFHATKASSWSASYSERWLRIMDKDLFPYIGKLPIATIQARDLLHALKRAEGRGVIETAHTLRQCAGQVFRYGVQTGRCASNPAPDLHGALRPVITKSMAAVLEPQKVGELMRAIYGYSGQPITRAALLLSALLFQRPGNIRAMEWAWIDLEKAMLTIPAQDMKRRLHEKRNGRPHFVPLAKQALQTLEEIAPLTGHGRYVFPSIRTGERPMSENTVNAALRRLGYTNDEMTAHGFRAMARTVMAEQLHGISPDVIEAQLAHGKSGPLGTAYDRAEFMDKRKEMMQRWADYLGQLAGNAQVRTLRAA